MAQLPVANAQNILPDRVTSGHVTDVDQRSLDHLSVFPWVYATGSCATSVVTEGHVTPSEVSLGCSLRRPRPMFSMVTGTSHRRLIFTMDVFCHVIFDVNIDVMDVRGRPQEFVAL
jgi:hypothetical protein